MMKPRFSPLPVFLLCFVTLQLLGEMCAHYSLLTDEEWSALVREGSGNEALRRICGEQAGWRTDKYGRLSSRRPLSQALPSSRRRVYNHICSRSIHRYPLSYFHLTLNHTKVVTQIPIRQYVGSHPRRSFRAIRLIRYEQSCISVSRRTTRLPDTGCACTTRKPSSK